MHRQELNGISDHDFVGLGAIVGDAHPAEATGFKAEGAEGAEKTIVRRFLLLIDAEGGVAIGMMDGDGRAGGAADVAAVGEADFVPAGLRKIGGKGHAFGAFAGLEVVQVTKANVGGSVGGVLPFALKLRLGFIDHDAGKGGGVGDDEGHFVRVVHLTGGVSIGKRLRMRSQVVAGR